jgi:hypothetical protein
MSDADQFRQYAEANLRWARRSTSDKEKKALLELANHWMQAAVQSDGKAADLPSLELISGARQG